MNDPSHGKSLRVESYTPLGSLWIEIINRPNLLVHALCCILIGLYIYVMNIKGISTDEGIRLGIINGNHINWDERLGSSAFWNEVLEALSQTSYQPLYYIITHSIVILFKSHDFTIFRLLNIFLMSGCMVVSLMVARRWPLWLRLFLIYTTFFHSYMFMHVLQIREYTLAFLFLSTIYMSTISILHQNSRLFSSREVLRYIGYGLLVGLGAMNSLWVLPSTVGAVIYLFFKSKYYFYRLFYLIFSFLGFCFIILIQYVMIGFYRKVDVGHWDAYASMSLLLRYALHDPYTTLVGSVGIFDRIPNDVGNINPLFLTIALTIFLISCLYPTLFSDKMSQIGDDKFQEYMSFSDNSRLSAIMLLTTLTFQIAYFFLIDGLSLWPRYFYQFFWLSHLLIASHIGFLWLKIKSGTWAPIYTIFAKSWIGLVVIMAGWFSLNSGIGYYRSPFEDTGMLRTCNWDILGEKIKQFDRQDPVVISRQLEALTITANHDFDGNVKTWENFVLQPNLWPKAFVLVNVSANSSKAELAGRLGIVQQHGYQFEERSMIAGSVCGMDTDLMRFRRD